MWATLGTGEVRCILEEAVSDMPAHLLKRDLFAFACLLALTATANAGAARGGGASADPYSHGGIGVDKQREAYRHVVHFEDNE